VKEWPVIFLIISGGGICCILLAFLWQETSMLAGELHSVAFLILCTILCLVDSTSSVVFLGYMSIFKPQYMTAYYIGDGLSALIPGLVGFGQGLGFDPDCVNSSSVFYNETSGENSTTWKVIAVNREPTFSTKIFFLFLAAVLGVSFIGFSVLHFASFSKKEHLPNADEDTDGEEKSGHTKAGELQDISTISQSDNPEKHAPRDADGRDPEKSSLTNPQLAGIVFMNFWMLFLAIGCYKGLESYAILPYGNRAYGLTVRLSRIFDPVACALTLFIPKISVKKMVGLTCIGTGCFAYVLTCAIMSPYPPLVDQLIGEVLAVSMLLYCTVMLS
jgi:riboflavin transporter 2